MLPRGFSVTMRGACARGSSFLESIPKIHASGWPVSHEIESGNGPQRAHRILATAARRATLPTDTRHSDRWNSAPNISAAEPLRRAVRNRGKRLDGAEKQPSFLLTRTAATQPAESRWRRRRSTTLTGGHNRAAGRSISGQIAIRPRWVCIVAVAAMVCSLPGEGGAPCDRRRVPPASQLVATKKTTGQSGGVGGQVARSKRGYLKRRRPAGRASDAARTCAYRWTSTKSRE